MSWSASSRLMPRLVATNELKSTTGSPGATKVRELIAISHEQKACPARSHGISWHTAKCHGRFRNQFDLGIISYEELEAAGRRFVLAPKNDDLRAPVAELDLAYLERRRAILQIMSANAVARVRGTAIRRFADFFRLESPKK